MTMTASFAVITTAAYVPSKVEAELCLKTLAGSDNPLAGGGRLERSIPGVGSSTSAIASGTTSFSNFAILPTALPSSMALVLEAHTGKRLLELSVEIVDYTSDWDHERVEILVTSKGMTAQIAQWLMLDADSYSWRLSVTATERGSTLRLTFELVQEEVAAEFLDALASTRLAFVASTSNGTQQAVIRPKRHKETLVPT